MDRQDYQSIIYCGFYTIGTPYAKVMGEFLQPTLDKYNLPYDIQGVKDLGSWSKNTSYKGKFILDMLEKHKKTLVILDADATIEQYPTLFSQIPQEYDMAVHYLDWCYDEKTEILTDQGWKLFKDLDKTEKVATLNPKTEQLEYYKPTRYIQYHYKGIMYHFNNKSVDLLVTPNHNIYYKDERGNKNTKIAQNMYHNQRFNLLKTCKWYGENSNFFLLPSYFNCYGNKGNLKYYKSPVKIPIKLWTEFLAWYLAEGWAGKGMVSIGQDSKSPYIREINSIIKKLCKYLKCNYNIYKYKGKVDNFVICSTQLVDYLSQFGKAKDKYIPIYIKKASSQIINLFIETYIKGDGTISKNKGKSIFTASKKMANDIEELILKIGKSSILYNKKSGFGSNIYHIIIKNRNEASIRRQYKQKCEYNSKVYCIQVKNHIIYARRNGKPCWSGNCKFWRNKEGDKSRMELLSGTMLFRYNPKVIKLMEKYIQRCIDKPSMTEQMNLQKVLETGIDIKVYRLPIEYCAIEKKSGRVPEYIKKPIIVHHQISRKLKNRQNWDKS